MNTGVFKSKVRKWNNYSELTVLCQKLSNTEYFIGNMQSLELVKYDSPAHSLYQEVEATYDVWVSNFNKCLNMI